MLEEKINRFFGDAESTGFGSGWWSGILSVFCGFLAFGAVLCLHFPQFLTSPEIRVHYPMHTMRIVIQCLIVAGVVFGVLSCLLRKKKVLAFTGMLFAIAATALGGSSVKINETLHDGFAVGLDWFPATGMEAARATYTGWRHMQDVAWHMVLPVTTLAVFLLTLIARFTRAVPSINRSSSCRTLRQQYQVNLRRP